MEHEVIRSGTASNRRFIDVDAHDLEPTFCEHAANSSAATAEIEKTAAGSDFFQAFQKGFELRDFGFRRNPRGFERRPVAPAISCRHGSR